MRSLVSRLASVVAVDILTARQCAEVHGTKVAEGTRRVMNINRTAATGSNDVSFLGCALYVYSRGFCQRSDQSITHPLINIHNFCGRGRTLCK